MYQLIGRELFQLATPESDPLCFFPTEVIHAFIGGGKRSLEDDLRIKLEFGDDWLDQELFPEVIEIDGDLDIISGNTIVRIPAGDYEVGARLDPTLRTFAG